MTNRITKPIKDGCSIGLNHFGALCVEVGLSELFRYETVSISTNGLIISKLFQPFHHMSKQNQSVLALR